MSQLYKQNSQYTFKFNSAMGRHGWLRLTPAYSVAMVDEILNSLSYTPQCVFEPFSGTGTTELLCANKGIKSFAHDINPFLIWLAKVKTATYSDSEIGCFLENSLEISNNYRLCIGGNYPPIHNIERWWAAPQLLFLSKIKESIDKITEEKIKDLLKIAFCRLLIELSNASFNHVSTSFKESSNDTNFFSEEVGKDMFLDICSMIGETAKINPIETPIIECFDSTILDANIVGKYDTVITSPPYPNRISYIRELRPYMYWLGYISTPDDASNLDWKTIGGTWGSATSKLSTWSQKSEILPAYLYEIAEKISIADNKSAKLMSNYVLKYFDDVAAHLSTVFQSIRNGGSVHYVIGNSNFYGNSVPSDKIYIDLMNEIGFRNTAASIVRKRNCNKMLYEFLISADK